jgi:DNA invertase Pin-like site-specific DNA recombinase
LTGLAASKTVHALEERNLIRERTVSATCRTGCCRARGRKGGRKAKMSKADVRKAAAMLLDPLMTKTEVAKHFGISRVTLNLALEREGYPQNPAAPQGETVA